MRLSMARRARILFYNVGGLAFSPIGLQTLCFERRFEEVTPPQGHSALTVTVADLDGLVRALDPASRS